MFTSVRVHFIGKRDDRMALMRVFNIVTDGESTVDMGYIQMIVTGGEFQSDESEVAVEIESKLEREGTEQKLYAIKMKDVRTKKELSFLKDVEEKEPEFTERIRKQFTEMLISRTPTPDHFPSLSYGGDLVVDNVVATLDDGTVFIISDVRLSVVLPGCDPSKMRSFAFAKAIRYPTMIRVQKKKDGNVAVMFLAEGSLYVIDGFNHKAPICLFRRTQLTPINLDKELPDRRTVIDAYFVPEVENHFVVALSDNSIRVFQLTEGKVVWKDKQALYVKELTRELDTVLSLRGMRFGPVLEGKNSQEQVPLHEWLFLWADAEKAQDWRIYAVRFDHVKCGFERGSSVTVRKVEPAKEVQPSLCSFDFLDNSLVFAVVSVNGASSFQVKKLSGPASKWIDVRADDLSWNIETRECVLFRTPTLVGRWSEGLFTIVRSGSGRLRIKCLILSSDVVGVGGIGKRRDEARMSATDFFCIVWPCHIVRLSWLKEMPTRLDPRKEYIQDAAKLARDKSLSDAESDASGRPVVLHPYDALKEIERRTKRLGKLIETRKKVQIMKEKYTSYIRKGSSILANLQKERSVSKINVLWRGTLELMGRIEHGKERNPSVIVSDAK